MKVLVEVSARHVHLSREAADILFGEGYKFTVKKELSQPGQFMCEERVEICGPRCSIKGVAILGPEREHTQVEVSATDARVLGIDTSILESGVREGSSGCKIVGPKGSYEIKEGVIIAQRHIHMPESDAKENNLSNGQKVYVKVDSDKRTLIFGDVIVRVSPNYSLAMHIDTDEANSAGINGFCYGKILLNNLMFS